MRNLAIIIMNLYRNGDTILFLQGALHVITLPPVMSVIVHDWTFMKTCLPTIVKVCTKYIW